MSQPVPMSRPGRGEYPCCGLRPLRIAMLAGLSLAVILVNKFGLAGNVVFFGSVFLLYAGRPATALAGVNIGLLALCANFAFVQKSAIWTIARFVNMFAFTGRFAIVGSAGYGWITTPAYLTFTGYCLVAALCSVLSGYYTMVALLKVFNFWVAITGVFACIYTIRRQRSDTTEWYVAQTATVCLMNMLALAMGVGANFKQAGWTQGLYNLGFYHAQTLGPLSAQMIVYSLCVYLFAGHRNRWVCLPLIGTLLYSIVLSGSRTGVGTLLFGIVVTLGCSLAWKRRGQAFVRLNVRRGTIVAAVVGGLLALTVVDLAIGGKITGKFVAFAAKRGRNVETVTVSEALSSRSGLAAMSFANFLESPVYGIGFQVAKTAYFQENATLFYAPVEKGFLPTALLEEGGILGTFAFLVFAVTMLGGLARERNIPGFTMFSMLLVTNLGEVSLFAMAGHGAYSWILVAGGIMLGDRCFRPLPSPAWPHWGGHAFARPQVGSAVPNGRLLPS